MSSRKRPPVLARTYHVDTRGRGYWIWADTGRRAPRPRTAPRLDSAGRPLDSAGRRIPKTALTDPPKPKAAPKPKPKPKPKPIRARDLDRPRTYHVDTLGRGFWIWADTGKRAPRPTWGAAPRYDRLGRPLDSAGRRIPKSALVALPESPKPRSRRTPVSPTRPTAKKRKKGIRVRATKPPRPMRVEIVAPGKVIPGFDPHNPIYWSHGALATPDDLRLVWNKWLKGLLRKTPLTSASEITVGQFGMVLQSHAPLDMAAFEAIRQMMASYPIEIAFRKNGPLWDIYLKGRVRERRTLRYGASGVGPVRAGFGQMEAAAARLHRYLEDEWDDEPWWALYVQTPDTLYEGGD